MENRIRMKIDAETLEEKIGFWFRVWKHPFLQAQTTRVITESLAEFGEYQYPKCLGADRFAALVRNVRPMNLVMTLSELMIKFSLEANSFQFIAYSETAGNLAKILNAFLANGAEEAAKAKTLAIGFDYHDVQKRMTGTNKIDRIWDGVRESSADANVCWTQKGETESRAERPKGSDKIDLIFGGEGDRFVVYDAWADRITGGISAQDPIGMTQFR